LKYFSLNLLFTFKTWLFLLECLFSDSKFKAFYFVLYYGWLWFIMISLFEIHFIEKFLLCCFFFALGIFCRLCDFFLYFVLFCFVLDFKLFENGNFDLQNVLRLILKFYTQRKVSFQSLELLNKKQSKIWNFYLVIFLNEKKFKTSSFTDVMILSMLFFRGPFIRS
jgi:hypothetical protein